MSNLTDRMIAAGVDVASADGETLREDAVRVTPEILAAALRVLVKHADAHDALSISVAVLNRWADEIERGA